MSSKLKPTIDITNKYRQFLEKVILCVLSYTEAMCPVKISGLAMCDYIISS